MTHHSTSVNMKKALSRERRGFTLVEMVVVVAIAVALMAIMLPAFKGLRGSKQSFAATTQFIGDLSTARLMAMDRQSAVYVVFMPPTSFIGSKYFYDPLRDKHRADRPIGWPAGEDYPPNPRWYFELPDEGNPRLGGQLVSYAFYAEHDINRDSLGSSSKRWLSDWKQLPEGAFFPSEMLKDLGEENIRYSNDEGDPPLEIPHVRNGSTNTVDVMGRGMRLPYIGFDARGQVIGVRDNRPGDRPRGVIIRLVEGGVLQPDMNSSVMDDRKFLVVDPATGLSFDADEPSTIGRAENYVFINFLTGRARTTVIKAVPAANKLVKIRIIRFTDRLWKWKALASAPSHLKGSYGFGEFLKDNRGGGTYDGNWIRAEAYEDTNGDGQRVLKDEWNGPPPDVIVNIPAMLASKLQGRVLRVDPDAELLIE